MCLSRPVGLDLCVCDPTCPLGTHNCLDLGPWSCGSLLCLRLLDQATPSNGDGGGKLSPWSRALDVHPKVSLRVRDARRGSGEGSRDSSVPMDGPTVMPPTSSWTV